MTITLNKVQIAGIVALLAGAAIAYASLINQPEAKAAVPFKNDVPSCQVEAGKGAVTTESTPSTSTTETHNTTTNMTTNTTTTKNVSHSHNLVNVDNVLNNNSILNNNEVNVLNDVVKVGDVNVDVIDNVTTTVTDVLNPVTSVLSIVKL